MVSWGIVCCCTSKNKPIGGCQIRPKLAKITILAPLPFTYFLTYNKKIYLKRSHFLWGFMILQMKIFFVCLFVFNWGDTIQRQDGLRTRELSQAPKEYVSHIEMWLIILPYKLTQPAAELCIRHSPLANWNKLYLRSCKKCDCKVLTTESVIE